MYAKSRLRLTARTQARGEKCTPIHAQCVLPYTPPTEHTHMHTHTHTDVFLSLGRENRWRRGIRIFKLFARFLVHLGRRQVIGVRISSTACRCRPANSVRIAVPGSPR